jgi:hypothetical protein
MKKDEKLKRELEKIASDILGIDTLETQWSDSLDFHEVSVWGLEKALKEAYKKGFEAAQKTRKEK